MHKINIIKKFIYLLIFIFSYFEIYQCKNKVKSKYPIVKGLLSKCIEIKEDRECKPNEILSAVIKPHLKMGQYRDSFFETITQEEGTDIHECINNCEKQENCISINFKDSDFTCALFSKNTKQIQDNFTTAAFFSCCQEIDVVSSTASDSNCKDFKTREQCDFGSTLMWSFRHGFMTQSTIDIQGKYNYDSTPQARRRECLNDDKCIAVAITTDAASTSYKFSDSREKTDNSNYDMFVLMCCQPSLIVKKPKVLDEYLNIDGNVSTCKHLSEVKYVVNCEKYVWKVFPDNLAKVRSGTLAVMENAELKTCKEKCLSYSYCENFFFQSLTKQCVMRLKFNDDKIDDNNFDYYQLVCCEDKRNTSGDILPRQSRPLNFNEVERYMKVKPRDRMPTWIFYTTFAIFCFLLIVLCPICYICRNQFIVLKRINPRGPSEDDDSE